MGDLIATMSMSVDGCIDDAGGGVDFGRCDQRRGAGWHHLPYRVRRS